MLVVYRLTNPKCIDSLMVSILFFHHLEAYFMALFSFAENIY